MRGGGREGGASGEKSVELYATFKTDRQQNSDDRQPGGSRGPQRVREKADSYTDDNLEVAVVRREADRKLTDTQMTTWR